jgi:hypothetical protein
MLISAIQAIEMARDTTTSAAYEKAVAQLAQRAHQRGETRPGAQHHGQQPPAQHPGAQPLSGGARSRPHRATVATPRSRRTRPATRPTGWP